MAADLRKSLGVVDGVVIAASSTAATSSIGIGMGLIAGAVGLHLPVIMLLAFLPVLGIAAAFARLSRTEPNCGNSYVWVGRSLSPWLGFLSGWVNIVGTVVFLAYTTTVTGSVVLQLAGEAGLHSVAGLVLDPGNTLQTTLIGLVILACVTVAAVTGIDVAARIQRYLLAFEYLVLLGFCGYGLFAGTHAFSSDWFNPLTIPSLSGLAQGMVLAVFCYWGFDAAFSVSEEVRDPRDARGGLIALVTMLALFLLGGTAFQRVLSPAQLADHGAEGLTFFGNRLAHQPLAALPLVALMFSAVASLQSGVIPTVRGMFAMGRDRTLGRVWTRIDPKYGTPALGTLLVGAIASLVAVGSLVIPRVSDLISAAVNAIGIVVALYYGLTALAAAVRFRGLLRGALREALGSVVAPVLSAMVLFALGGYMCWGYATSTDHFALSADNGWFALMVPVLMVVSGVLAAAWAKWVRRSAYFDTGPATDADAPYLLAPGPTTVRPHHPTPHQPRSTA
ncbi:APC family permease [Streptomyces sp. NPDC088348]|uniref:APC family permease n=1 Tax=Streptomyces sp. NPDC088348 TaxID=3365853 RepID=UPI003822299D